MWTHITIIIILALLLSACESLPAARIPFINHVTTDIPERCGGNPENRNNTTTFSGLNIIKEIQARLILQGYETGQIDGIYGRKTEQGIRTYQADYHLPVDGRPSPELLEHLKYTQQTSGIGVIKTNLDNTRQSNRQ